MNAKLIQVAEKRAVLISRAAAQRAALSQSMGELARPMRSAGHGADVLRKLAHNPLALAALALVALKAPWRKLVKVPFKVPRLVWLSWLVVRTIRNFNRRRLR